MIFFGIIGSQSGPAASAVAPALRSGVVAAGVPAGYANRIEAQFRVCLHDRLVAADPTVTPASCQPKAGQVITPATQRVLRGRARARSGTTSLPRWSAPCGSRSACSC